MYLWYIFCHQECCPWQINVVWITMLHLIIVLMQGEWYWNSKQNGCTINLCMKNKNKYTCIYFCFCLFFMYTNRAGTYELYIYSRKVKFLLWFDFLVNVSSLYMVPDLTPGWVIWASSYLGTFLLFALNAPIFSANI